MEEKPLELYRCFVPHLGGLTWPLVTSPIFSLRKLIKDLKKADFTFKILVKPRDFVADRYVNIIYMRIVKHFLRFMNFEIILIFRSEAIILKD